MNKNILYDIAHRLTVVGEHDLADKIFCALAALEDEAVQTDPKPEITYSSMMRQLRKDNSDETRLEFQRVFKQAFEDALDENMDNAEHVALTTALKAIENAEA